MKTYIKMEQKITFSDTEIEKQNFHQFKGPISIKYIDINKIVGFNKVSFGKKKLRTVSNKEFDTVMNQHTIKNT